MGGRGPTPYQILEQQAAAEKAKQDALTPKYASYQDILKGIPEAPKMDLSEAIERRKAGLGGYSSEESAAMRSQLALDLGRQQEAQRRQLLAAQAKSGIRGGAAAAQQQRFGETAMAQRAAGQQDLFIKNIAEQQRRQKELESLQQNQQFGNLAAELTRMQLAQAESAKQAELEAARVGAQGQIQAAKEGGTIICTELHRQGLMSSAIFEADQSFGDLVWNTDRAVMVGYHFLARPIVRKMQQSRAFSKAVAFFAMPWAQEMAYEMGTMDKGSIFGRFIMRIGFPACRFVGNVFCRKTLRAIEARG